VDGVTNRKPPENIEKPSYFKIWVEAARPKTLPAGVAPVLIGTSMAVSEGKWDILSGLCALIGAIFIQVGANYANDYFDYLKGADSAERLGPRRVTQAGLVKPESMRFATLLVFLFACVPGSSFSQWSTPQDLFHWDILGLLIYLYWFILVLSPLQAPITFTRGSSLLMPS
jgi:1,4-dihydroxy-2-naphthoate octaprenyltransferase